MEVCEYGNRVSMGMEVWSMGMVVLERGIRACEYGNGCL